MKLICDCGMLIEESECEEGVNGTDYYECSNCGRTFNVLKSKVEEG